MYNAIWSNYETVLENWIFPLQGKVLELHAGVRFENQCVNRANEKRSI